MKTTKQRKVRNKNASEKEKIQGLILLRQNNYNYSTTCAMLGISYNTLKNWEKLHGKQVDEDLLDKDGNDNKSIEIDKLTYEDIKSLENNIYVTSMNIKKQVLLKLSRFIKYESDPKTLVDVLKSMHQLSAAEPEGLKETTKEKPDYLAMVIEAQQRVDAEMKRRKEGKYKPNIISD